MLSASRRCRCVSRRRRGGARRTGGGGHGVRASARHRGASARCGRRRARARPEQCRPHSFLASSSHHQRPARSGSPTPHRAGAGRAADRREAAVVQRVVGNALVGDVALDVRPAPVGERVDLEEAVGRVELGEGRRRRGSRDCSARRPVIQPAAPSSARPSGSTLRMPQHALRASTEARKPLMPCAATSASSAVASRREGRDAQAVALLGRGPEVVGFREQPAGVEGDDLDRRARRAAIAWVIAWSSRPKLVVNTSRPGDVRRDREPRADRAATALGQAREQRSQVHGPLPERHAPERPVAPIVSCRQSR